MTRTALYRHFDAAGALLYVGVSADPTRRTYEHKARSEWARDIVRSEIQWFENRADAAEAETKAIHAESPLHNVKFSTAALQAHMAALVNRPRGQGVSLGDWLKAQGIKQSQAAEVLGLSRGYMSELCGGTKSPGLNLAILIEDFTGGEITVRDLADFYDDAQSRRAKSDQLLSCEVS